MASNSSKEKASGTLAVPFVIVDYDGAMDVGAKEEYNSFDVAPNPEEADPPPMHAEKVISILRHHDRHRTFEEMRRRAGPGGSDLLATISM